MNPICSKCGTEVTLYSIGSNYYHPCDGQHKDESLRLDIACRIAAAMISEGTILVSTCAPEEFAKQLVTTAFYCADALIAKAKESHGH